MIYRTKDEHANHYTTDADLSYEIGICYFYAKHTALKSKSKDLLARNQNNVSEWSDISTQWLLLAHLAKGNVTAPGVIHTGRFFVLIPL
jgi:hypothetical protein